MQTISFLLVISMFVALVAYLVRISALNRELELRVERDFITIKQLERKVRELAEP